MGRNASLLNALLLAYLVFLSIKLMHVVQVSVAVHNQTLSFRTDFMYFYFLVIQVFCLHICAFHVCLVPLVVRRVRLPEINGC